MGKRDNKGAGTSPAPGEQPDLSQQPQGSNQGDTGSQDDQGALPLRTDGPTLAEYVAAGYPADSYPPQGYAAREPGPEADLEKAAFEAKLARTTVMPTMSSTVHALARLAEVAGQHKAHAALTHLELALAGVKHAIAGCDGVLPEDAADFVNQIAGIV